MSQLAKLAKPFPASLVKPPPQGKYGSYVEHGTVTQALLATCGPFSQHVREILRGYVAETTVKKTGEVKTALENAVVGVILALVVTVDGREVTIEEVGDVGDPHNWDTDGARMKDAISDAIKRCAMRLGLGLSLWTGSDDYFLDKSLAKQNGQEEPPHDVAAAD